VTFDAVRCLARAIAATMGATRPDGSRPALAIGFDTRFLSQAFAQAAAEVVGAAGLDAFLSAGYVPTPVLAWSIPALGAQGGLAITASHNPGGYNGVKVRVADGGPAAASLTAEIEVAAAAIGRDGCSRGAAVRGRETRDAGTIHAVDLFPRYRQRVCDLVRVDRLARAGLAVLIDPMYGATQGLVAALLRDLGLEVEEIHGEVNPWFGGQPPEPVPQALGELSARVKGLRGRRAIGLAFDGDGDRLAAIDERGSYVTPHQIFALLLRHLVVRRHLSGTVVKTVSTSAMIDRLAAAHCLRLVVTPIGFKHVADVFRREAVLIGGEESGGIGVAGHIPERDGILTALLLLECLAIEDKPLAMLLDDLRAEVGPHHYRRIDVPLARAGEGPMLDRRIVDDLPGRIGARQVADVQMLDGVKVVLEDGSWLLVRQSGTEPVLRLYAEAPTPDQVSGLLEWAVRRVASRCSGDDASLGARQWLGGGA